MTTTRTMFTIADAAAQCGVTTKTIQRKLPQLAELDAVKDEHGRWTIPYEALLSVGLQPGKPAGPDRVDSPKDTPSVSEQKVRADVRAEMDSLRHRAVLAEELLAAERRMTRRLESTVELLTHQLTTGDTEKRAPAATEPAAKVINGAQEAAATITEPAATVPVKRKRWWQF